MLGRVGCSRHRLAEVGVLQLPVRSSQSEAPSPRPSSAPHSVIEEGEQEALVTGDDRPCSASPVTGCWVPRPRTGRTRSPSGRTLSPSAMLCRCNVRSEGDQPVWARSKPVSGRIFFKQVILGNLGRPNQISIICDRRLKHIRPRHARTIPHPGDRRRSDGARIRSADPGPVGREKC